jgi:hypothetical protein
MKVLPRTVGHRRGATVFPELTKIFRGASSWPPSQWITAADGLDRRDQHQQQQHHFLPGFFLESKGGLSGPIRVGRFCNVNGRWHDVFEKVVDYRSDGNLCLIRTTCNGVVRDLSSKETHVNDNPVPCCQPLFNFAVIQEMAAEVPNIIQMLHFELRGKRLVIYSPWCPAGSIAEEMRGGHFTPGERAGILCGVWPALDDLNRTG